MATRTLFYATNRQHIGKNRWRPTRYGTKFSDDGMENLRFGKLTVAVDEQRVSDYLGMDMGAVGTADGEGLSTYLSQCARTAQIVAYEERLEPDKADIPQENKKLGSKAMFADLQQLMLKKSDVVVFIHGFNVSWHAAVGSALALQEVLSAAQSADPAQQVAVVLFTWPSDGLAMPFASYKSDRTEAAGSGFAFGRGLLKVRDFLVTIRRSGGNLCQQDIHLLCHSMGNYVLQHTLARLADFTPGSLPRIFEHVFLCAPDVNDDVLEPALPLGRVHEIARTVTVYHNRGDTALVISDHTKGNPDRLGSAGTARPAQLHSKIHQVDCSPIVEGLVEHSYYLVGHVKDDIRASVDSKALDDPVRRRQRDRTYANVWSMTS